MNRMLSLVLLAAGIILLIYGFAASDSFGSSVSRAVNGAPTDKAIWLLVGGGILAALGLGGLLRGGRTP